MIQLFYKFIKLSKGALIKFIQLLESIYIKNFTNFKGRSSKDESIHVLIFNVSLGITLGIIDTYGALASFFSLITIIPWLALSVRRLHDVNKSGWYMLLIFTIIGLIPYLVLLFKKGDVGTNNFGENEILKHYSSENKK